MYGCKLCSGERAALASTAQSLVAAQVLLSAGFCAFAEMKRCASLWAPVVALQTARVAAGARPSSVSSRACGLTLSRRALAAQARRRAFRHAAAIPASQGMKMATALVTQARTLPANLCRQQAAFFRAYPAARLRRRSVRAPPALVFAASAVVAAAGAAALAAGATAGGSRWVAAVAPTPLRCFARSSSMLSRARCLKHRWPLAAAPAGPAPTVAWTSSSYPQLGRRVRGSSCPQITRSPTPALLSLRRRAPRRGPHRRRRRRRRSPTFAPTAQP